MGLFGGNNEENGDFGESEKVHIQHKNQKMVDVSNYLMFGGLFFLIFGLICLNIEALRNIGPLSVFVYVISMIPRNIFIYMIIIGPIPLIASIVINSTALKKTKFDHWIGDIASRQISTEYIWYAKDYIYLNFDRNLNRKDIMDFVRIISDKSTNYTYYCEGIDINMAITKLKVVKKEVIPNRSSIKIETDTAWNIIPLGDAVNNELKTISPICWWINDNIKRDDVIQTLPSTSLLVAGGTGSGKSVFENNIIGHISRFPDNFQLILCDVKMVEFGRLKNVQSVKKVALTLEEVEEAIKQSRQIMMDRFQFMQQNGVNNVYKLKDVEVDYFEINGKKYQFDECFAVVIDGKDCFMTLDKIYEAVQEGKDVEIDESYGAM